MEGEEEGVLIRSFVLICIPSIRLRFGIDFRFCLHFALRLSLILSLLFSYILSYSFLFLDLLYYNFSLFFSRSHSIYLSIYV